MEQERLTERVKEAIGKIVTEMAENFKEDKNRASYATIEYNFGNGRIILVMWPGDNAINANWTPVSAGYGDLGTLIGAVSMEYFGINTMTQLLVDIISNFMEK